MTDLTELHEWDLPVPDSISQEDRDTWAIPIRQFWDSNLDKEVPLRGPQVDRPTAGSFPGLVWIVTDSTPPQITFDTGSEWATLSDDLSQVVDASDFDGADGGAQIQAAIDSLPGSGGTVWVPPGTWNVSSHILLRSNITLISSGATLFLTAASDDNIVMTNEAEGDATVSNVVIDGFQMDGNRANNGQWTNPAGKTINPACIWVLESDTVQIRNCQFTSSVGYGVKFVKTTNSTARACSATDMGDDGFTATDTRYTAATTRDCTFVDCYANANVDAGFEVDDGPQRILFSNCVAVNNEKGFHTHTHNFTDTPASPQNIFHANCSAINNQRGFMNGGHFFDDQAVGMFYQNIVAEGNSENAFTAGAAGSGDFPATGLYVDGFRFEHPASATGPAIDMSSGGTVAYWSFENGTVISGRRGVTGGGSAEYITFDKVEFDLSTMTASESGAEFSAGSSGRVTDITFTNCKIHGAQDAGLRCWTAGGRLTRIQVDGGRYYDNGNDTSGTNDVRAGISIADNGATPDMCVVTGIIATDTRGSASKTQSFGIYFDGVADSSFTGNMLADNATGATGGTLGANSVTTGNVT